MIKQRSFTLMKRNEELNKLTKRGEIHMLSQPGKGSILYVETWGYERGNGFAVEFPVTGTNLWDYAHKRLVAKGLFPLDDKNARIIVQDYDREETVQALVQELLSQKFAREEDIATIKHSIGRYDRTPMLSDPELWTKVYDYTLVRLMDREAGGLVVCSYNESTAVPPKDSIVRLEPDQKYQEWGAF